jgi:hypothetical protein
MGQSSMNLSQRPGWRADELIELIRQRAERWWPKDLQLAVTVRDDGDWMVVSGKGVTGCGWEPELAFSIARVVGEVRSRNAWNGY